MIRLRLPDVFARSWRLRPVGLVLIASVLLAAGGVLARPYVGTAIGRAQDPDEPYVAKTDGPTAPVIVIRCYESGFVIPDGLEDLPSGEYTVVIRNRSGYDAPLGIEFGKKGESPAVSQALPWGQDLVFTITLDTGSFEIKETSRPEWSRELAVAG